LGPNTGVVARVASGLIRWQCGALDQAVTSVTEALAIAREIDHPFSIAYALYHYGFLALMRGRFDDCMQTTRELAEVAEENDYVVWSTLATVLEGVSLTALGETEEGLTMAETGIELYQGLTTPPIFWPLILLLRATVHAYAGLPDRALRLIDEAITLSVSNYAISPEFKVYKGDFIRMTQQPDLAAAEDAYLAAARDARRAGLLLIELEATTRLVGLRREMGTTPDGTEELASLYESFTEGFDENALVAAREVLER
jgi:tetratricopeptide (TPR) repeat protein